MHLKHLKCMIVLGCCYMSSAWGAIIEGVEMQPGEWTKTIPGIPVATGEQLNASVQLPPMVCNVDIAFIRSSVSRAGSDGTLAAKLAQLENYGNTGGSTAGAIRVFSSNNPAGTSVVGIDAQTVRFSVDSGSVNSDWSAGRPTTLRPNDPSVSQGRNCLQLSDAQTLVLRLREVIRLYLGMPPPSVPLQGLPPPQR